MIEENTPEFEEATRRAMQIALTDGKPAIVKAIREHGMLPSGMKIHISATDEEFVLRLQFDGLPDHEIMFTGKRTQDEGIH